MTAEQLKQIAPGIKHNVVETFLPHLNIYMERYEINTPLRQAAFIAQLLHESGGFRYVREIWGPTTAQRGYEGRKDLGNVIKGDGERFKGRGLIQITGRANYEHVSKALTGSGTTFTDNPELLTAPCYAVESAAWFWKDRGLNELADKRDFEKITRRINGGLNGLVDRQKYYGLALDVLGV